MKKFSKVLAICLTVCLCALCLVGLVACKHDDGDKTVTVVIGEENPLVYTVKTDEVYLYDLLEELEESKSLHLVSSESAYGRFITEVGNIKQNELAQEYIYIYTTDVSEQDITDYAMKTEYDGKQLVSVVKGASSLPLKDGETYMLAIVKFEY